MTNRTTHAWSGLQHLHVPEFDGSVAAPGRVMLDAARSLATRFAGAGLRRVALVRAPFWDSEDRRIWLALENLQITGSFKVRGALCAMAAARDAGIDHVIASSAGNHGAGVALAARYLSMKATITVPENAPNRKTDAMQGAGVTVERVKGSYDAAEAHALALAERTGRPFVSPYDDELVALGNGGSLGFEIVDALGRVPERVMCPIGGGGLATGLAWGLGHAAGEDPSRRRRVWTVQSECSPAFAESIKSRRAVELLEPTGPTLAEGLEGGISRRGFGRARAVVQGVSVATEPQIAEAMRALWHEFGLRVEGSGAVAVVPLLVGDLDEKCSGDVVVVLTGRNVDDQVFRRVVDGARPW